MISPHYIDEFKAWLREPEMNIVDKLLKNILQEQHGISIDILLQENITGEDNLQEITNTITDVIEFESNIPLLDVILPLDQPQILT